MDIKYTSYIFMIHTIFIIIVMEDIYHYTSGQVFECPYYLFKSLHYTLSDGNRTCADFSFQLISFFYPVSSYKFRASM